MMETFDFKNAKYCKTGEQLQKNTNYTIEHLILII